MARLDAEEHLKNFLPTDPGPGYGYQLGEKSPSEVLSSLRSLDRFNFWGPLDACSFKKPPAGAKRQPDERLYEGRRIVIGGIRSGFGPPARLETEPFSFQRKIYCLPVHSIPLWQAETILGTLLSALGRYRLFMASGSWVFGETRSSVRIFSLSRCAWRGRGQASLSESRGSFAYCPDSRHQ